MGNYKRFSPKALFKNNRVQKIIIAIVTFIILFVICSMGVIPQKYNLKEGDIAPVDIKAPRDFIDDISTQEKIDKAVAAVSDKYSKNLSVKTDAIEKIRLFFEKAVEIKNMDKKDDEKIQELKSASQLDLKDEEYASILKMKDDEVKNLSSFLENCLAKILSQDILSNSESDIKKAKDDFSFYIENSSMTSDMKKVCYSAGIPLIKPNLYFDVTKTKELMEEAKRQVQPTVYKKNQNIVLKGEVVSSRHIYLMRKAGLLKENKSADLVLYIGTAAIIAVLEMIVALYLYKYKRAVFNSNNKLVIIAIIICINAFFATGINIISEYLIPAALIAMLVSLIFDSFIAFFISIPSAITIALITNFNIESTLLYVAGCMSGILFVTNAHERNNIFLGGLYSGILNGFMILSIGLVNNVNIKQNLLQSSIAVGGGILSAILALGILPVFEQLFDIITPIKLLELSNPNHPLLKRLLFEAPGTYHHSVLVGNLAEAAADGVGADSLLARAGAYYHDIGKIKRPYFFKENQITNDNPHDKITPKLSTLIITSHVKDGLELASKYGLPGAIRDLIEQHHGTTLVKYFYVMASNESSEQVEEASFRYEGPKPKTRESAIIMLADSVEAAVRSLNKPAIHDVEKMVERVVEDKISDGQLDEADLTLKDIERIKQAFIKVLIGIFHNRIEYPEISTKPEEEGGISGDRV